MLVGQFSAYAAKCCLHLCCITSLAFVVVKRIRDVDTRLNNSERELRGIP